MTASMGWWGGKEIGGSTFKSFSVQQTLRYFSSNLLKPKNTRSMPVRRTRRWKK